MPRGQEKFLCIVDLKGWGYSNWDIRAYIAAIEIMQVCSSISYTISGFPPSVNVCKTTQKFPFLWHNTKFVL